MAFRSVPAKHLSRLMAVLMLSGCAMIDNLVAHIDNEDPALGWPRGASTPMARPTASGKPPSTVARRLDPEMLVGKSEAQLIDLLGRPADIREEPPANVWRYGSGKSCTVDIFLYFDIANSDFRSLSYKIIPAASRRSTKRRCLAALVSGRKKTAGN
jgi:hypothetical protein